jgi:hypothetical protein
MYSLLKFQIATQILIRAVDWPNGPFRFPTKAGFPKKLEIYVIQNTEIYCLLVVIASDYELKDMI